MQLAPDVCKVAASAGKQAQPAGALMQLGKLLDFSGPPSPLPLQECVELQAQNHAEYPAACVGHAVHALVCEGQAGHAILQSATLAVCNPLQGQLASMASASAQSPPQGTWPSVHMVHTWRQDVPERQPGSPSILGSAAAAFRWLACALCPVCPHEHALNWGPGAACWQSAS